MGGGGVIREGACLTLYIIVGAHSGERANENVYAYSRKYGFPTETNINLAQFFDDFVYPWSLLWITLRTFSYHILNISFALRAFQDLAVPYTWQRRTLRLQTSI